MARQEGVLIETYWNVNNAVNASVTISLVVLIETYWNVNRRNKVRFVVEQMVLIETYWNVNFCEHEEKNSSEAF